MEPVGAASDWEVWKWIISVIAGAFGGIVAAVIAVGSLIFKLNNNTLDVNALKDIVYKKGQGLNVLTKEEHRVLCETTFELWGKDFDHLREKFNDLEDKVDKKFDDLEEKVDSMAEKVEVMVTTGKTFETHAKDLVAAMHALLEKIDKNKEDLAG